MPSKDIIEAICNRCGKNSEILKKETRFIETCNFSDFNDNYGFDHTFIFAITVWFGRDVNSIKGFYMADEVHVCDFVIALFKKYTEYLKSLGYERSLEYMKKPYSKATFDKNTKTIKYENLNVSINYGTNFPYFISNDNPACENKNQKPIISLSKNNLIMFNFSDWDFARGISYIINYSVLHFANELFIEESFISKRRRELDPDVKNPVGFNNFLDEINKYNHLYFRRDGFIPENYTSTMLSSKAYITVDFFPHIKNIYIQKSVMERYEMFSVSFVKIHCMVFNNGWTRIDHPAICEESRVDPNQKPVQKSTKAEMWRYLDRMMPSDANANANQYSYTGTGSTGRRLGNF